MSLEESLKTALGAQGYEELLAAIDDVVTRGEAIPMLGASRVKALRAARATGGRFERVTDLLDVPHMGLQSLGSLLAHASPDPAAIASVLEMVTESSEEELKAAANLPEPSVQAVLRLVNHAPSGAWLDERVDGLGHKTAAAILKRRTMLGGFDGVLELLDVPGVGEARLDALVAAAEQPLDEGKERVRIELDESRLARFDLEGRPDLTKTLLFVPGKLDPKTALPAPLETRLSSLIRPGRTVRSLRRDPALRHPVLGELPRAIARVLTEGLERARIELSPEDWHHVVVATIGEEPESEPAAPAFPGLTADETETLLTRSNETPEAELAERLGSELAERVAAGRPYTDTAALIDAVGAERASLGGLFDTTPEPSESGLAVWLLDLDFEGLEELFRPVVGARAGRVADTLLDRRELLGGRPALEELAEHPELARPTSELREWLESSSDCCRIRIDGPDNPTIFDIVNYFGVLEDGPAGGTWEWKIIPAGRNASYVWTGSSARTGGPLLVFQPRRVRTYVIALTYTVRGCRCTAVREIVVPMPECMVRFMQGRTVIAPNRRWYRYRVVVYPEADPVWTLNDPDSLVTRWQANGKVLELETGADTGSFTVFARHPNCPETASREITVREGRRPPAPSQCRVRIVDHPRTLKVGTPATFKAEGSPTPGMYSWVVMMTGETGTGDTFVFTPRDAGTSTIIVTWVTDTGCRATAEVQLQVEAEEPDNGDDPRDTEDPTIYGEEIDEDADVALVRRRRPNKAKPSIPKVQHVPNVFPTMPGHRRTLSMGGEYEVWEIRVLGPWERPGGTPFGLQPIDLSKLDPSVRINLRCAGLLRDTLIKIDAMEVIVDGEHHFPFGPGEYTDTTFDKWHPGEDRNVKVEGLGVHHLEFRPTNDIGNLGQYHADIVVELSEDGARAVTDARRLLDEILRGPAGAFGGAGAHAARIIARTRNLVSAWRSALASVEVRCLHNTHALHATNLSEGCHFRVRGFPDDNPATTKGEVEAEPIPKILIDLKRDAARRHLSDEPDDYFVTDPTYSDAYFDFASDGLLKGNIQQMGRGYFPPGGETDEEIIYGVGADDAGCHEIDLGDTITLGASGLPTSWKNIKGLYTWSVASKPEGATVTFRPRGPTTNPLTEMEVDRSGRYTIRVDYVIDRPGESCNQTYAILDVHVIIRAEAKIRLERVGPYEGALAPHKSRFYYRRRTLEQQEGADLLVYPDGGPDLGHARTMFFSVPSTLELDEELTARVYTKADRSEYRDYTGAPYVRVGIAGPNTAAFELETLEPIYAIHVMKIRYTGLLQHEGHAVEVSLTVLGGPKCPVRLEDGPTAIQIPEIEEPTAATLVNLVLYEHDLGDAGAGNASIEPLAGPDSLTTNIANGNLTIDVPLFSCDGRGNALGASLHYSSFRAMQVAAFERAAELNEISDTQLEKEFIRTPLGWGWTWNHGVHVLDYVLSEAGTNLRRRAEVVGADGDIVQFEATSPTSDVYRPVARGALWAGDATSGASLRLEAQRGDSGAVTGWRLTDLSRTLWTFDSEGRLLTMESLESQRSNGALAPVRLGQSPGAVVVTDTVGRTLTLSMSGRFATDLTDSLGRSYTPQIDGGGHLVEIDAPEQLDYGFVNHPQWGHITEVENPASRTISIEHHLMGDAWGRLHQVERSGLKSVYTYEPVENDPISKAKYVDPREIEHEVKWDRDSLAATRHRLKQPEASTPLGPVDEHWKTIGLWTYHPEVIGTGKLFATCTDQAGITITRTYSGDAAERIYQIETEKRDGVELYAWTYHADTREIETENTKRGTTRFEYDGFGNLKKRIPPRLSRGQGRAVDEEWQYAADGTLIWHRSAADVLTTYAYGGDRDPHGVGLPTSHTRGSLTWTQSFHAHGGQHEVTEPFFGGTTTYLYDELGRSKETRFPEGDVRRYGSVQREQRYVKTERNGHGQITRQIERAGTIRYTFDDHGRISHRRDPDGLEATTWDALHASLTSRDRRGNTWTFERDAVGRKVKILHPPTASGQLVEYFHHDDHARTVEHLLGHASGDSVSYPRRKTTTVRGGHGEIVEITVVTQVSSNRHGPVARWEWKRDDYGALTALTFSLDGTQKYEETYELDEWGRMIGATVSGATTDYEFDGTGKVCKVTAPPHGGASRATWEFHYDEHGRTTGVTDPYGRRMTRIVYLDASANRPATHRFEGVALEHPVSNATVHATSAAPHTVLKTTTFDARGYAVTEQVRGTEKITQQYDERGNLVYREAGPNRMAYEVDFQGRRIRLDGSGPNGNSYTRRSYDDEGNLVEVWDLHTRYTTRYAYDALDRLTSESRVYRDNSRETPRRLTYDPLGRVERIERDDGNHTDITYDDRRMRVRAVTDGDEREVLTVSYHWNGHFSDYSFRVGGRRVVHQTASPPDSHGHVARVDTTAAGMSGSVEIQRYPAGTVSNRIVRVGQRTLTEGPYRYHPDWQLAAMGSEGRGSDYAFRYHPSGALQAIVNPRGEVSTLNWSMFGDVDNIEVFRGGTAAARYTQGTQHHRPANGPNPGRPSHSDTYEFHASGDDPSSGLTRYHSEATYDVDGHMDTTLHRRMGLGPNVSHASDIRYDYRGRIWRMEEAHRFEDDSLDFTVTRRHSYRNDNDEVDTELDTDLASLVSRFTGRNITYRDVSRRVYRTVNRNYVDPDVFTFVGDPRYWMHQTQSFDRDARGRVTYSSTIMDRSSDRDDVTTFQQTPHRNMVRFYYGASGELVAREITVKTVDKDNKKRTLEDKRLFLRDGADLLAEVDGSNDLVRRYEYGPGSGLRLNVTHDREGAERTDEYVYGLGLSSVALADSSGHIVRRFSYQALPGAGDDRNERFDEETDLDKVLLSPASPLYVAAAAPTRGGLPPGIRAGSAPVLGSRLIERPDESNLGLLLPSPALFEPVHAAGVQFVDPSELPRLNEEDSAWDWFLDALDFLMSWNPITGPSYRMIKGIYAVLASGDGDSIRLLVSELLWGVVQAITKIPLNPIQPLMMWAEGRDYSAADYLLATFELRDPLVMINGFDPVTGATFTWEQRLEGMDGLAMAAAGGALGAAGARHAPAAATGRGCLPTGTPVATVQGPIDIDQLRPGDRVLHPLGSAVVEDIHVHVEELWQLSWSGGALVSSSTQPIATAERGFVEAADLHIGEHVIDERGEPHALTAVSPLERRAPVYNISLGTPHVYFAGERPIVVHNKPSRLGRMAAARAARQKPPNAARLKTVANRVKNATVKQARHPGVFVPNAMRSRSTRKRGLGYRDSLDKKVPKPGPGTQFPAEHRIPRTMLKHAQKYFDKLFASGRHPELENHPIRKGVNLVEWDTRSRNSSLAGRVDRPGSADVQAAIAKNAPVKVIEDMIDAALGEHVKGQPRQVIFDLDDLPGS